MATIFPVPSIRRTGYQGAGFPLREYNLLKEGTIGRKLLYGIIKQERRNEDSRDKRWG